jgi:hypothetical protein
MWPLVLALVMLLPVIWPDVTADREQARLILTARVYVAFGLVASTIFLIRYLSLRSRSAKDQRVAQNRV